MGMREEQTSKNAGLTKAQRRFGLMNSMKMEGCWAYRQAELSTRPRKSFGRSMLVPNGEERVEDQVKKKRNNRQRSRRAASWRAGEHLIGQKVIGRRRLFRVIRKNIRRRNGTLPLFHK